MRKLLESARFDGIWKLSEPMKNHTTMRVGGDADAVLFPGSIEDVCRAAELCAQNGIKCTVLGRGSNVIVSDDGIKGLVVMFDEHLSDVQLMRNIIRAKAGAGLSALSQLAARKSLTGLEFAEGIPGTIGGAVLMNAGAYGGEIKDLVVSVLVLTKEQEVLRLSDAQCGFSYRHSRIMDEGHIVLEVELSLKPGDPEAIRGVMDTYRAQRREKQPLNLPSAGSFFKRPEGLFAGKLIEEAGMKGANIGGAQISEKHAGFMVNTGSASCADIIELMQRVKQAVYAHSGVCLEPEVRFIGRGI